MEKKSKAAALCLTLLLAPGAVSGQERGDVADRPEETTETRGEDANAQPSTPPQDPGPGVTVESLSGSERFPLEGLDWKLENASPRVAIQIAGKTFPLEEVLFLKFSRAPSRGDLFELGLHGGDRVKGTIHEGGEDVIRVRNSAWGDEPTEVQVENLRSIVVSSAFPDGAAAAVFRERQLAGKASTDRLFLSTGDPIEGIVEAVEKGGVRFSSRNLGEILYPYDKVRAVQFADLEDDEEVEAEKKGVITAVIHFADGSVLSGLMERLESRTVGLDHPDLGPLDLDVGSLLQVSFRGGRLQFLSDLETANVKEHLGILFTEAAARAYAHRRDQSVMGTPMRMRDQAYAKGLGVHSYSLLEFDLGGDFQRFQATVGLDDSARPDPGGPAAGGAVVFRVYLDSKKLVETRNTYRDPPRFLDLDISGGKTLGLEVDFGKTGFDPALDRANWAEARIIK